MSANEMTFLSSILRNRLAPNTWQKQMDDALESTILGSSGQPSPSGASTDSSSISRNADKLADRVKAEGAVLFPSAISGQLLDIMRAEFDQMIETSDRCSYVVDKHDGAVCIRVDPRSSLDKKAYPITAAFFDSHVFRKIARSFYRDESEGFHFNNTFFVHETPETTSPLSGKLHWDRTQALKFWVYVDDIPVEAGPMRIHPGSTARNKAERIKRRQNSEQLEGGKDNVVSAEPDEMIYLAGPAGSVLVHDSDCSHGASPVSNGYVRRIMRGHCRAVRLSKTNALKQVMLNPQDFHRC